MIHWYLPYGELLPTFTSVFCAVVLLSVLFSLPVLLYDWWADCQASRLDTEGHSSRSQWQSHTEVAQPYYPRSKSDVFEVAFILRQVLVHDIVPQILDEAGYWTQQTIVRNAERRISENGAGTIYLETQPIQTSMRYSVRRIVFEVRSKDQGWSSYPRQHGTYDGSWTWFGVTKSQHPKNEMRTRGVNRQQESTSILLFRNIHAGRQVQTHTIEWTDRHDDDEIRNFVRSLVHGDCIQLGVWARFPNWFNHVLGARISIYIAHVR